MELDEQPITMLDSSSWLGSKILNLKTGVRTTYRVPIPQITYVNLQVQNIGDSKQKNPFCICIQS